MGDCVYLDQAVRALTYVTLHYSAVHELTVSVLIAGVQIFFDGSWMRIRQGIHATSLLVSRFEEAG
jgi:hypothetical protein